MEALEDEEPFPGVGCRPPHKEPLNEGSKSSLTRHQARAIAERNAEADWIVATGRWSDAEYARLSAAIAAVAPEHASEARRHLRNYALASDESRVALATERLTEQQRERARRLRQA